MDNKPPAPDNAGETAFFPGRAPIDAYGNDGFRFAEMSHRGSLLCLPAGIYAWSPPAEPGALTGDDFALLFANLEGVAFLLLGTGDSQIFPSAGLRRAFDERGIGLEPMSTGSAARTYNVLLAESRDVAAALYAVA